MSWAHFHLMVNHLPLFGALAGTILLGVSAAQKRQESARAGFVVIVLTALVAGAVYWTGEPAEDLVKDLPGVSTAIMERHEEVALVATMVTAAFGLIALYGLVRWRHGVSLRYTRGALILSLVPLAVLAYTAYLGGQIRHSEIRQGALPGPATTVARRRADGDP